MMDAKLLKYFVAVAEDLHFTRAADRLHIAQSALSVRIRTLEETLQTRLFHREKRSAVRLTEAGRIFLEQARKAVRVMEETERIGRRAGKGELGELEIGFIASAVFSGILPAMLRRFRQTRPDVTVKLIEMETPRQIGLIEQGALDMGIVRAREVVGIRMIPLCRETLHILLPSDHPLAALPSVGLDQLSGETFISPQFDEAAGFGNMIRQLAEGEDFVPGDIMPVRDFLATVSLVSGGYGVALVPEGIGKIAGKDAVLRALKQCDLDATLALALPDRSRSPVVEAFLHCATGAKPA